MTDILDMVDGEEYYNAAELNANELLDDEHEENNFQREIKHEEPEADDLYDAAIEPSGTLTEKRESIETVTNKSLSGTNVINPPINTPGKRYCCYVGNMTWWTTDQDLQALVKSVGVLDLVDIKFYENRNNGQSKGFALAVFASETSVKTIMERLSTKKLHDQLLLVLPYNKQSLAKFEEATKRTDPKEKKEEKLPAGMVNIGTVRIGHHTAPAPPMSMGIQLGGRSLPNPQQQPTSLAQTMNNPQITSLMNLNFPGANGMHHQMQMRQQPPIMGQQPSSQVQQQRPPGMNMSGPPPNMTAPPPVQGQMMMNRPPPSFQQGIAGLNTSAPPPLRTNIPPPVMNPMAGHQPGFPAGAHINPQVYPTFAQNYGNVSIDNNPMNGGISEAVFEETMNRNRTVSSAAITRAVRDAAAGDFGSAIETLVTAVSLIRQSPVANDERCKVIIAALDDTLQGIESKYYSASSSRKHRSGRDRSRSPSDRSSRKRHRRSSRSRSRSRDRYAYDSPPRHSSRGR